MAKHTQKPWLNNGGRIEAERLDKPNVVIATVGVVNEQTPEDTANAKLIVAAPELLAVCQAICAVHGAESLGVLWPKLTAAIREASGCEAAMGIRVQLVDGSTETVSQEELEAAAVIFDRS